MASATGSGRGGSSGSRGGGSGGRGGGSGGRAGKPGSARKGPRLGSGGNGRQALAGRGPTPKAEDRPGHPAARRAAAASRRSQATPRPGREDVEVVVGRNPVVEALRAGVPANALLVVPGLERDERLVEALALAGERDLPVLEVSRSDLDRAGNGALHQGLALRVPPYRYQHPEDLLAATADTPAPALLVALDGVTDPRNLGAVVRSAAAFGAHGVIVPERRAAGMTASAWKVSAGAATRVPVARATNLARTLGDCRRAGLLTVGLAADGALSLDDFDAATEPLVLVVGSEGRGLSRLVSDGCDLRLRIPLAAAVESLNAAVAAGVVLADVARRRRATTAR